MGPATSPPTPPPALGSWVRLDVLLLLAVNIFSVVGIVALNKQIYLAGFKLPTLLMCFHFWCTWSFVVVVKNLGWFQEKRIPWTNYALLGFAQMCSVAFVNLSLVHNSVGTYQLLKFSNIILMCVLEYAWKRRVYPAAVYASLVTLVTGVSLSTVSQVNFSWLGLACGLLGAISTAAYQVLNKSIQTEHEVQSLQLLHFEQPFSAAFSFLFSLATDDYASLATTHFTAGLVALLLLSGAFAFGVNVSCYAIIGKTSAITYGVIGHTKTIGILFYGFVILGEPTTTKQMVGLLLALSGIVIYTHLTTAPSAPTGATPEKSAQVIATGCSSSSVSGSVVVTAPGEASNQYAMAPSFLVASGTAKSQ